VGGSSAKARTGGEKKGRGGGNPDAIRESEHVDPFLETKKTGELPKEARKATRGSRGCQADLTFTHARSQSAGKRVSEAPGALRRHASFSTARASARMAPQSLGQTPPNGRPACPHIRRSSMSQNRWIPAIALAGLLTIAQPGWAQLATTRVATGLFQADFRDLFARGFPTCLRSGAGGNHSNHQQRDADFPILFGHQHAV
jgi:hypothetical protein